MRDLIITLLVFGSIPFILSRPYVGILVWNWLSLMNPHRLSWGFAYSMPFAAVIAAFTLVALVFTKEKKTYPFNAVTITHICFIVWMCITTVFAYNIDYAMFDFQRMIKIQLMTIVLMMVMTNRERLHQLVWVIVISIGFFGVKGGVFSILTGGSYRVWGPTGTFIEDNNTLALALVMVIPLMRFLQTQSTNKWISWALTASMLLCTASIVFSYSRGAFLAISAMAFLMWLKGSKKMLVGVFMVLLIVVGLPFVPDKWFDRMNTIETYEEDASAMGRVNAWTFATNLAMDRPLGGGFGAYTPSLFELYAPIPEDFHDAHSIYFEVLGEHGFVGLAFFLLLGVLIFRHARSLIKLAKDKPELSWARDLAAMIQVSLFGYVVGGTFLGLAYYDLPYALMAILVCTYAAAKKQIEESNTADKPISLATKRHSV